MYQTRLLHAIKVHPRGLGPGPAPADGDHTGLQAPNRPAAVSERCRTVHMTGYRMLWQEQGSHAGADPLTHACCERYPAPAASMACEGTECLDVITTCQATPTGDCNHAAASTGRNYRQAPHKKPACGLPAPKLRTQGSATATDASIAPIPAVHSRTGLPVYADHSAGTSWHASLPARLSPQCASSNVHSYSMKPPEARVSRLCEPLHELKLCPTSLREGNSAARTLDAND